MMMSGQDEECSQNILVLVVERGMIPTRPADAYSLRVLPPQNAPSANDEPRCALCSCEQRGHAFNNAGRMSRCSSGLRSIFAWGRYRLRHDRDVFPQGMTSSSSVPANTLFPCTERLRIMPCPLTLEKGTDRGLLHLIHVMIRNNILSNGDRNDVVPFRSGRFTKVSSDGLLRGMRLPPQSPFSKHRTIPSLPLPGLFGSHPFRPTSFPTPSPRRTFSFFLRSLSLPGILHHRFLPEDASANGVLSAPLSFPRAGQQALPCAIAAFLTDPKTKLSPLSSFFFNLLQNTSHQTKELDGTSVLC